MATTDTAKAKWPEHKVRWRESWIVRAMVVVTLILCAGFLASAITAFQSIDSVSRLAHNQEVETSLRAHLDSIRKTHELRQKLIVERLSPIVAPWATTAPSKVTVMKLREWLRLAELSSMTNYKAVKIKQLDESIDEKQPLKWVSKDKLRLLNFDLDFPKGELHEAFKTTETILQRYQIIGFKLDEKIRPTLIWTNSVVLIVCFVLLLSLFVFLVNRIKMRIQMISDGFTSWSDDNQQFRFDPSFRGELKLITNQFNAMADEVEENQKRNLYLEKVASWQVIARKLAHEIKNPLTPIQMMVSQLKRRYKGEDQDFAKLLDEAQSIISEEVAGLRRMVDNFSQFARLPMPEPVNVDLLNLCNHIIELEKAAFGDHVILLETSLSTANGPVDETLLRQVLINLIKNAAEASGDKPSKIVLTLEKDTEHIFFHVQDDGPGIPSDLQSRIFEAYFTTKHTGPTPGMGLGLAVCQKIIVDHGGRMTVTSKPGNTTFTIQLPATLPKGLIHGTDED